MTTNTLHQNPNIFNTKVAFAAAALNYATRYQWATFPSKRRSKSPATLHGFKDASADPAQITAWAKQDSAANIAFEPGRHGLVVVDFDRTDGDAGDLLRRCDATAPTKNATSPTGGVHRFYRLPPGETLPSTQNTPCPGVDIRSTGGYVLLAPSIVTYTGKDAIKKGVPEGYTGAYRWANDLEPALIPTWLLQALRTPATPPAKTFTTQAPARTRKDDLATIGDAAAALGHLAPGRCDDYTSWIATGQALQELGPMGLALWDTWSRDSAKYEEGECARKWASFKRTGRGMGTLFYMAGQDSPGYRRPAGNNGDNEEHGHPTDGDDPPPDAPMPGTRSLREVADDLQAWALESEFAGKLRAADVKRLDGPRAVYVALCTLARRHNTITLRPGLRMLGELAGMSHESARANLERLAAAGVVTLVCNATLTVGLRLGGTTVNLSSHMAGETYAASVADDAFTTYPVKWAQKRRPGVELVPGMGRGAAVPWAYMLADGGQWTARMLSEAAGMTVNTARTALKRLEAAGLATVSRAKAYAPNVYTLIEDATATLDALRPTMATFGSNARRALNNALQAEAWAYRNAQSGPEWQQPRQEARRKLADTTARKWAQHLEAAGINWRARVLPPRPPKARKDRYDRRELAETWWSMGDSPDQRSALMLSAGWDDLEVKIAAQAAHKYAPRWAYEAQGMAAD